MSRASDEGDAARVTLSYQSGLSDWSARRLERDEFRDLVREGAPRAAVGDAHVLEHGVGCCGAIVARLRVKDVDGGRAVGPGTEVELVRRETPVQDQ